MEKAAELRFHVERSIRAYLEQRRQTLDGFLDANFGFSGTLRIFWQTARTDVLRHTLNFVLAIPFLLVGKIAGWLDKFGLYGAGKAAQKLPTRIPTRFERRREQQIVSGLLGLAAERDGNGLLHRLEGDGLREALNRSPGLRSWRSDDGSPIRKPDRTRGLIFSSVPEPAAFSMTSFRHTPPHFRSLSGALR